MALVVRVKRRCDEEPHEALLLSCKKRKTSPGSDESVTAVFKFAGTVARPDECVKGNLSQFLEKQGIKDISKPALDVLKKSRREAKFQSDKSRYKLVNYFRSLDGSPLRDEGESEERKGDVTVLDVEAHPESKSNQGTSLKTDGNECLPKTEVEFVYDLYHKELDHDIADVDDLLLDELVSVNPLDTELVFESYREHRAQAADSDSEENFEDEDSNDENNWRNDYPDEDDNQSDRDSLANDMERVMIGNEELSSDDELNVYDGKLTTDELLYGAGYAKYKKRVCDEFCEDESSNSSKSSSSNSCSDLSGINMDE